MRRNTWCTLLCSAAVLLFCPRASAQDGGRGALLEQLTAGIEAPAVRAEPVPEAAARGTAEGEAPEASYATASGSGAARSDAVEALRVAPLKPSENERPPAPETAKRAQVEDDEAPPARKARGHTPLSELKERQAGSTSPSMGYVLVGVLLLGLAGVAYWLKRRGARKSPWKEASQIETLATRRVHGKHAVSIIRVAGRLLVVGVSDKGMTLLTELDERDLPEAPAAAQAADNEKGASTFLQRLGQLANVARREERQPDPFHAALEEDAPVDELVRLEERAAIRKRLEAMRRRNEERVGRSGAPMAVAV